MAAGCKKCDPHEICEECPEWIFTLADLIMCMMGLFVLLWVLKPGGAPSAAAAAADPSASAAADKAAAKAREEWMNDFRKGFGDSSLFNTVDPNRPDKRYGVPKSGPGAGSESTTPRETPPGTDDNAQSVRPGVAAPIGGRVPFELNSAELTPDAKAVIAEIANIVRGHKTILIVKGHAGRDEWADMANADRLRMELSIRRAQAVTDALVAAGIDPQVLRVQGAGTFEPVRSRGWEQQSAVANRRVEVEQTNTPVSQYQPPVPNTPAAPGTLGGATPTPAPNPPPQH